VEEERNAQKWTENVCLGVHRRGVSVAVWRKALDDDGSGMMYRVITVTNTCAWQASFGSMLDALRYVPTAIKRHKSIIGLSIEQPDGSYEHIIRNRKYVNVVQLNSVTA